MCKLSPKEFSDIPLVILGKAPALPHFKEACKWLALASEGHHFIARVFSDHLLSHQRLSSSATVKKFSLSKQKKFSKEEISVRGTWVKSTVLFNF